MEDRQEFQQIEKMIADENSPVGIDAKKTHILILQKLMEIEERLDKIESQQEQTNNKS